MLFAVDPAHRQFFHSYGWINFQDVLSVKESQAIWHSLDDHASNHVFEKRANEQKHAQMLYEKSRDWHSQNATAKKITSKLCSIAAGLWNQRPLMLIADQIWSMPLPAVLQEALLSSKGALIEQMWSAQPLLGVLIMAVGPALKEGPNRQEAKEAHLESDIEPALHDQSFHFLPQVPGEAIFLRADQYVKMPAIHSHLKWWVMVFAGSNARYHPTALDPLRERYRQKGVPEQGKLSLARLPVIAG